MKKILLLILSLTILVACGQKSTNFDPETYSQSEMAYVVLGVKNNAATTISTSNYFYFQGSKGKVELILDNGVQTFMLPPGEYKLTKYGIYDSVTTGNLTRTVDLEFKNEINGRFTVAAGDVVYLGHVDFNITNVKKNSFKKFFGFGSNASDVQYDTAVSDKMDSLNKAKYEAEADAPLISNIMEWVKK